jgi:hypothetical protein
MWLGAATFGVAALPLVVRFAATLDSYTTVAIIDVALVLLSLPQRVGTAILMAVVPHAARSGTAAMTISRRENLIAIVPFIVVAAIAAFTPTVGWLFDLLGRHVYAKSGEYLAMALLAGPARIMYGVVEGVLIARLDGRFLALTVLSVAVVASGAILAAAALSSALVAFTIFVGAFWVIYLVALARVGRAVQYEPVLAGG